MKCIFCKNDSAGSKSIEHVIPESIGNLGHVLPVGMVCDNCNTYFGLKVEKPLLETPYFRGMCFRGRIKNKEGNPPRVLGLQLQSLVPVELFPDMDGSGMSMATANYGDEKRWIESNRNSQGGTLIVPIPDEPEAYLLSRFLCKVAVEALALRSIDVPGGLQEIVDKEELDPIRNYARKGGPVKFWPYNKRALYPPDSCFYGSGYGPYEVLHEWTFMYTAEKELYFALALFGVEYAVNLGGPELDGYRSWLSLHSDRSPLYPEGMNSIELGHQHGRA